MGKEDNDLTTQEKIAQTQNNSSKNLFTAACEENFKVQADPPETRTGWDKPTINFITDALMFLVMMTMAGLGFLMKYVLIPGRERWIKYGRNVELTLLGMDRHDWGSIHLYLGFTLLGLLTLHIILHWKQIVGLFCRCITPERRTVVLLVFVLLAVVLIYFPFLITPEVQELGRGGGRLHR